MPIVRHSDNQIYAVERKNARQVINGIESSAMVAWQPHRPNWAATMPGDRLAPGIGPALDAV